MRLVLRRTAAHPSFSVRAQVSIPFPCPMSFVLCICARGPSGLVPLFRKYDPISQERISLVVRFSRTLCAPYDVLSVRRHSTAAGHIGMPEYSDSCRCYLEPFRASRKSKRIFFLTLCSRLAHPLRSQSVSASEMAELLSKAKDQVVEALSQATAAVSLGAPSGQSPESLEGLHGAVCRSRADGASEPCVQMHCMSTKRPATTRPATVRRPSRSRRSEVPSSRG